MRVHSLIRATLLSWALLTLSLMGFGGLPSRAQTNPPANDDFAGATILPKDHSVTTVTGTLVGATREPGEPYNSNGVASVWYKWTPALSGYFRMVSGAPVSTWVFSASEPMTNLVTLGRDGDKPWLEAGTAYYLGIFGSPVDFELKIETVPTRPSNDDFINAQTLAEIDSTAVVAGTGLGATYELGEPLNTNALASVWFQWTPSKSGRVRFASDRPLPKTWFFVTAPNLRQQGSFFSGLLNIAREGQSPYLAAGVKYYIAVYTERKEASDFEFTIELVQTPEQPPPANDDFLNAAAVEDHNGFLLVSGTNLGSTFEANEPYFGNSFGAVWYKWTPSARVLGFTSIRGERGPRFFSGTTLENLTYIQTLAELIPGQQYFLSVNDGGAIGTDFEFALQVETPSVSDRRPYNDDFGRAVELRQPVGTLILSLEGATVEPGEPVNESGCIEPARSVWNKFTAPVDGLFQIDMKSTLLDRKWLELFTGESLETLVPVAAEKTSIGEQFSVAAGQTYYLRAIWCVETSVSLDYAFVPTVLPAGASGDSRLAQTIALAPIPDVSFGAAPITVDATCNSGLPVTLSVVAGPATITGATLSFSGGGFVTVVASQPGNRVYDAAPEVRRTFCVRPSSQSLIFPPVDTSVNPVRLSAHSSSGLPIRFEVISGCATISGDTITGCEEGPITVLAFQPGNADYEPAQPISQTLIITRIPQTIDFPQVGDIQLPGATPDTQPLVQSRQFGKSMTLPPSAKTVRVSACASSGLPVTLEVRSGPGEISGRLLEVYAPGEIVLAAVQNGDVVFARASAEQIIRAFDPTLDPPRLCVDKVAGQATLTWPAAYTGFTLETTANLTGPWLEIGLPLDSHIFEYLVDPTDRPRFFRLKKERTF